MRETQVYEIYDPETGRGMGVAPTRYQAAKEAKSLGYRVRRVWVRRIVTNAPEKFANCPKR